MSKKRALVTGISGMDGSHLADFLLTKDYEVFGLERRSSSRHRINTKHLEGKITFLTGDLSDQNSLLRALKASEPTEFYNIGAQSFVGESWNTPEQTSDITGLGVLRCLEAIRESGMRVKFYQASSSEMFGNMENNVADENTPFSPRSPYGVSKLYGHWITRNYRESYNMFNCSGILFNHESERRGLEFVTRKITNGVARIVTGLDDKIVLGNIKAKRDWGYAPDYVKAMWLMLQQDTPDDFVIATGEVHSVEEFIEAAFTSVGISDWYNYVKTDAAYRRPADVEYLKGSAVKAKNILGWGPTISFKELVTRMVESDIQVYGDK
jgi:GDPmannose 4,6-dehydratase